MQKPKITFLLLGLFLVQLSLQSIAQSRNYITNEYNAIYRDRPFYPDVVKWRQKELTEIQNKIDALSSEQKDYYIALANKANQYQWPSLTASLYLDYKHNGIRVNYENLHSERQQMVSHLAIGALIKNDDTYIRQLVNGIWLMLEESTWVAPAHIVVQKEGAELPSVTTEYIDLYASRTAYRMALIYHLLNDKLDKYSKVVNKRILYELDKRIFRPYLTHNDYWWMGFKGNFVNNWNTFSNTNCFKALLYAQMSADTLQRLAPKIFSSTDKFLNHYPADGGCDEGPSYWNLAGGKLIGMLSDLEEVSNKRVSFADKELIHNIGTYTYKLHIDDNKYANFADASALNTQNPVSIFLYGQMFNDNDLKQFAAFMFNQRQKKLGNDLIDFVEMLKVYPSLEATSPKAPYPLTVSLPNLQVFAGRQQNGTSNGLYFAIKGGNNAESHNHNDIGNFVVYADGEPILIDAGVGVYTSKTFSSRRYETWNVQSGWHNCPTINGYDQRNGKKYAASAVKTLHTPTLEKISLNIAGAYPKEAQVNYWNRTLVLDRQKRQLTVAEKFSLNQKLKNSELNFISAVKPLVQNNQLSFGDKAILQFDNAKLEVIISEKMLDDARLAATWGEKIYRIRLVAKKQKLKDTYQITIRTP